MLSLHCGDLALRRIEATRAPGCSLQQCRQSSFSSRHWWYVGLCLVCRQSSTTTASTMTHMLRSYLQQKPIVACKSHNSSALCRPATRHDSIHRHNSVDPAPAARHPGNILAAAALAAALLTSPVQPAVADAAVATTNSSSAAVPTVYFGNGCFWGRQKEFVDTEKSLGRTDPAVISSVVGYAGGRQTGPNGKVCYYYNADPRTIYERLGHAEVVQVALSDEQTAAQQEFRMFADTYFSQFQQAPRGRGMMRLDPQDSGPGYRNVVGLPGGVKSPYFKVLQAANVNKMELREGKGNVYNQGQAAEKDELNVIWVVDSDDLPFYRAEMYHQFHNGIGKAFSPAYTRDLKAAAAAAGKIGPTGCLEVPF